MNHKRKRPKSARAGCLLCKPWKVLGNSAEAKRRTQRRADEAFKAQVS